DLTEQFERAIGRNEAAAFYILAHIGTFKRFVPFVCAGIVEFDKILEMTNEWGSGLSAMGRLAAHIFNPHAEGRDITPFQIFLSLDEYNREIAFKALEIAYK
ncbi:MAG: hypothetical protein GX957_06465, partial [Clostridiaceae bacterium]|nr:hypothetical protein [Clostridiaceae bacterium]